MDVTVNTCNSSEDLGTYGKMSLYSCEEVIARAELSKSIYEVVVGLDSGVRRWKSLCLHPP